MKTLIQLFGILVFLAFTLFFNIGLVDIRFKEVNYLLDKVAFDSDASNALGIVAKYELIKRRMELGEENTGTYEIEAKVQALLSRSQYENEREDAGERKYLQLPIRILLNAIRFTLGKEIVNPMGENEIFKVLEIAYFWERNRKYAEAIKIYDNVMKMPDVGPVIWSAVLIHKAFCYSMMSDYKKAVEIYELVISRYPNTEAGVLSWKLLDFIQSIQKKVDQVKEYTTGDFDRAKEYYLYMDYRNAIKYLSIFLQQNKDAPEVAQARYFKGRSHEEIGETEEAVMEYRNTIANDKTKRWAREANRRMVMLGEFYDYRSKMSQEAEKQLKAYQDESFMSTMNKFKSIMPEPTKANKELLAKIRQSGGANQPTDANALELLNAIGAIDLTGANDLKQQAEKGEAQPRPQPIANTVAAQAAARELEHEKMLSENPFRRPSYIKTVIDENVNQLKYIYNRELRRGSKLSGKILVEIEIRANGVIQRSTIIKSSMGDKNFENEIVSKINTWQFRPVPDSLGTMKIRYPFEFYESND